MRSQVAGAGKAAGIGLLAAAPIAIHFAVVTGKWPALIFAIPLLQLIVIGAAMLARPGTWRRWLVTAGVLSLLALVYGEVSRLDLAGVSGIPHALAYSSLFVAFGISLLPGHEPVLTRLVCRVRGPLPPGLYAHTRHVTVVWCLFFAGQLVASLTLFLFAPIEIWSLFVNVLNLPLVAAMFVIEYIYRVLRFPDYPHDKLSDIMKFVAEFSKRASRQADSV
jgi:uncharacterized membrane protein